MQLDELEARLEEERARLRQLREALVRDPSGRGDGGEARRRARDVNRRIVEDQGGDAPVFSTASQNVMAAALLLRAMPEPSTPEGKRVHQGLRGLLEQAMVLNVESSASQSQSTRRRGDRPPPNKAPTVQGPPPLTPKEATRPRRYTSASEQAWTCGPPLRPDDVTGTKPNPDVTDPAELNLLANRCGRRHRDRKDL